MAPPSSHDFEMGRRGATRIRMAAMLVVALGAGILCTTQGQWSFLFRHESIQQLQQLPENSVAHLVGVVIYADEQGGQYWVEDKTGAVPIALNPGWPGIHVGDTISIEARKVASTDLGSGGLAPKPGSQRPSLRSQMGGGEGPMRLRQIRARQRGCPSRMRHPKSG